jgi:Fungal Zn(2)-Cys(6) binuclear cluster domain
MAPYHSESPPGPTCGPSHSDHAQGPPRKKMRKGTKSCLECRRRKIRCTFEPGSTAVCKECYARGSTCIDQEHGDTQVVSSTTSDQAYSLRERVTQLEEMVKEVLNRIPEGGDRRSSASSSAAADTHTGTGTGKTKACIHCMELILSQQQKSSKVFEIHR